MQKASILMAVVFALPLFLVSGAYAQSQGMDRMNSNYRYQSTTQESSYYGSTAPDAYTESNRNRYYEQHESTPPGMPMERGQFYYEPQGTSQGFSNVPPSVPPGTLYMESVVPPPTASDVRSERINRRHTRPAQVYVEKQQGIPTSIAPEGSRRAMDQRPSMRGYYPQSGQQDQYSPNEPY